MLPKQSSIGKETKSEIVDVVFPPQHQNRHPGRENEMNPRPVSENQKVMGSGKLQNKIAIITGGDSGIGRAVAYEFAKEGAHIAIIYYNEHDDANETKARVEELGRKCITISGDLKDEVMSQKVVKETIDTFGKIDILVNNHAVQYVQESLLQITAEQLDTTFRTNIYAYFFLTKAALPYLKAGSCIINTASVTAYHGHKKLIDYAATKGAIVTFTRSLSESLISQGIRVNGVAPGPIWSPLIPSSFSAEDVKTFGTYPKGVPMKRPGQPFEIAPSYVFLASDDSSYMSGQILHPNGGNITSS